jgi:glycosyltransferase involved in cell wall biosynthesis
VKVLLVADAVGGVFSYAVELSRALVAHGVEVVLATEGARLAPDQRRAVAGIAGLVHEESAFRLEWMEEPWEDVTAAGRWLLELEARHGPDVVHTNELAHGALPFAAPKLVVGHSCVLSWFEAVRREPAPPAWDRYREVVGEGLRGADALAAPSAAMAAALVRHHGPLPPPVVVPNGRDPRRFAPGPKEEIILGAGRLWDEAKNAAALARIAPRLPWPVFIAGDTAAPGAGAAPASPAGAPEAHGGALTFLGRLSEPEMARWLRTAAIFAHPARYEPFGLAVLEAALCGCALVLGDVPSLRETWEGAAELVPPDDDEALVERLRALAGEPARRSELASRARARARRFTPERMAERTLALYRSLTARAPRSPRHGALP